MCSYWWAWVCFFLGRQVSARDGHYSKNAPPTATSFQHTPGCSIFSPRFHNMPCPLWTTWLWGEFCPYMSSLSWGLTLIGNQSSWAPTLTFLLLCQTIRETWLTVEKGNCLACPFPRLNCHLCGSLEAPVWSRELWTNISDTWFCLWVAEGSWEVISLTLVSFWTIKIIKLALPATLRCWKSQREWRHHKL